MAETPTLKSIDVKGSQFDSCEARAVHGTAMLSDRGRVRHENQDTCAARSEIGAYVVCDGMGGAAAGEVASGLAAEAFLRSLGQATGERGHRRMFEAVRAANEAVFQHSCRSPGLRGMGTTLVGAMWDESEAGTLWLGHVGDSRCYRLRGGTLELLTQDHSLVEEQVRAGRMSRVEAESSPIRNIITRAVGSEPLVEPEIAALATEPGDVYLLATDGLTRELADARIAGILTEVFSCATAETTTDNARRGALAKACVALIDAANAAGGHDNITVLLIAC